MTKIKTLLSSSLLLLLLVGCESSDESTPTPNSDISAANLSSSEILNGTWNISHVNLTASTAGGFLSCSLVDDTMHFGTMTFNQTDSTVVLS